MKQKNKVVYLHKKPKTNEVYYVWIWSPRRPYRHWSRNPLRWNYYNKYWKKVEILHTGLTEKKASKIERKLIKKYWRISEWTGILCNITEWGEIEKRTEQTKKKIAKANQKKIIQYDKEMNIVKVRDGIKKAAKAIGVSRNCISDCCQWKSSMSGWFKREYYNHPKYWISMSEENRKKRIQETQNKQNKRVIQYDEKMNKIKVRPSIKKASQKLNIANGSISNCCLWNLKIAWWFKREYYNHPKYWINMSEEDKQKRIKETKNKNSKKVIQYDKKMNKVKVRKSIVSAAESLDIHPMSISSCCKHKTKTSWGFKREYYNHPKYWINMSNKNKKEKLKKDKNKRYRKIVQYDKKMNKIKIWSSIKKAAKGLGLSKSAISNCCRWKSKTSWWYKREYYNK